jgi:hypothetical protein
MSSLQGFNQLRVLNSLQTVMIGRSIVVTLGRSEGPSKQCRHGVTVPAILKPGLLPVLIVR